MTAVHLDRYIAITVLKSVATVLACLLVLVTLFTLVDEFRDITPGYTKGHAVMYVLYTMPRQLYDLVPYAAFIGALVGLGVLASRTELTVLRAAGVSMVRLFVSAAVPMTYDIAPVDPATAEDRRRCDYPSAATCTTNRPTSSWVPLRHRFSS